MILTWDRVGVSDGAVGVAVAGVGVGAAAAGNMDSKVQTRPDLNGSRLRPRVLRLIVTWIGLDWTGLANDA
ncbi:hypothetical protein PYCC9005_003359 [Savitreella phatthalungensis]